MQGYNNDNDDYIQGAASAFGFAGAHVHVKLDFIDAAYAGAWSKPAAAPDDPAALQTVGVCLSRPFFDLLLRRSVRANAMPSISSENSGGYARSVKLEGVGEDYCGLLWTPTRSLRGQVLLKGPSYLGLKVAGGWLRRMFTYGDGLVQVLPGCDMARYLDQFTTMLSPQKKNPKIKSLDRHVRVPKQRHYQPGAPAPPHHRQRNPAVKWSSPQWRPMGGITGNADGDAPHHVRGADATGLSPWGRANGHADASGRTEAKVANGPPPSRLCDLCFLLDHHFDADRKSMLQRAQASGIDRLVLLPSGSSVADAQALLHRCKGHYRPSTPIVATVMAKAAASLGRGKEEGEDGEATTLSSLKRSDMPGKKLFGLSDYQETQEPSGAVPPEREPPSAALPSSIIAGAIIGVHPHDASLWTPKASKAYAALAQSNPNVVAIGVIGLDFQRLMSSVEAQKEALYGQLKLAKRLALAAVVTEHWASEEMIDALTQKESMTSHVLLLGFNGSEERAQAYLDCHPGLYIGLNGALCQTEDGRTLRAMLRNGVIPLDRLVIYTGAPFNHPGNSRRKKWKRCEPRNQRRVVKMVAKCIGGEIEEVEEILEINHTILFGLRPAALIKAE
jgi:TatD DNase family protein